MSAVSRNGENDRVRRLRDEYETRETQSEKKKNAEIKRLKQKHAEELNEVSDAYSNQMDSTRNKSQEEAKKAEQRHQDQIYDVSKLHRNQLRKKLEEASATRDIIKNNAKVEVEETQKRGEVQRLDLAEKSKMIISEKDKNFSETFDKMATSNQEKFKEHSAKLSELRQKDAKQFNTIQSHDKKSNYEKTKMIEASYQEKLANLERSKNNQIEKLNEKYKINKESNEMFQSGELKALDEMQQVEKQRIKEKFEAKSEKNLKENNDVNERYRTTLGERAGSQISSKDSQIKDLKQKSVSERINQNRLHKVEKENLVRDYEAKLALLQESRDLEIGMLKEKNVDKNLKHYEQTSSLISDANKNFKQEMQLKTHVNRLDRENLVQNFNDKIAATDDRAQRRIDKINNLSQKNQENISQLYSEKSEKLKEMFDQRLDKNRESQITTQLEQKEQAQNRLREIERSYAKKLNYIVSQKDDEIDKLKNQLERVERSTQDFTSQRLKEHYKVSDKEKQAIVDKYERYIGRVKDNYSEEIDRLRERHRKEIVEASNKQAEAIKNLRKG